MKAIAAMAENRAIGINGKLPWPSIKEDFKWFKEFTMGKTLVVGRKTYNTLPTLRGRNIVVITRDYLPLLEECILHPKCEKMYTRSYEQMIKNIIKVSESGDETFKDAIIAGGAKIYELFLPHITEFYITHINGEYEADTYMPSFECFFNNKQVIAEFGAHKIIKYTKQYEIQ